MSKLIFLMFVVVNGFRPLIKLDIIDVWFTSERKDISWTFHNTESCLYPLTSDLDLINCEDGQLIKRSSTGNVSFSINSEDFARSRNFYQLSARDSTSAACGSLSYLLRVDTTGKNECCFPIAFLSWPNTTLVSTETHSVTEGNEFCLDLSSISFQGLTVFWPTTTGSSEICSCAVFLETTQFSFSDCYCLHQRRTDYLVSFNSSTLELCWKDLHIAMNGTMVGLTRDVHTVACGEYSQRARIFLKSILILVNGGT